MMSKNKLILPRYLSVVASIVFSASFGKGAILAIDLGAGVTQEGFGTYVVWDGDVAADGTKHVSMSYSSGMAGYTAPTGYGSITVTLDANTGMNYRNRAVGPSANGDFTYTGIIKDRIATGGAADSTGMILTISGLLPNTQYVLQIWGWDSNGSANGGSKAGTNKLYNVTGGRPEDDANLVSFGSYTTTAGQLPVDNNSFSATNVITTDANGTLAVLSYNLVDGIDGRGIMNAFMLSEIPEPSSALLSVMGAGLLMSRRRR